MAEGHHAARRPSGGAGSWRRARRRASRRGATRRRWAGRRAPRPARPGARRRSIAGTARPAPPPSVAPPAARSGPSGRPRRPHGRTMSTTAITTKISTIETRGRIRMPKAFSTPMSSEARSAPHTEPMPPMTTTTKASTMTVVSITVVSGTRGTCSAPASPARNAAEHEDAGEEPRLVHAERGDHLAVLRRGADQHAPARAVEDEPEPERDQGPEDDHREVVGREELAEERHRAREARRLGAGLVVRAPDEGHGVGHHEHEREGEQELVELGRPVHAPQQRHLEQAARRAPTASAASSARHVEGRAPPSGSDGDERVRQVRRQHVERAVGEVDDARDAEDQREAGRDEEQEHRVGEPAEELDREERQRSALPEDCACGGYSAGRGRSAAREPSGSEGSQVAQPWPSFGARALNCPSGASSPRRPTAAPSRRGRTRGRS